MNSRIVAFPIAERHMTVAACTQIGFTLNYAGETTQLILASRRSRTIWRSVASMIGAALCLIAALCLPTPARAQSASLIVPVSAPAPQRTLTTAGTGEVKVSPDYITFTVGVRVQNPVLEKATADESARTRAILTALSKQGIESKFIQTDRIAIEPTYTTRDGKVVLDSYYVQRTASVRLETPSRFDDVLTAVLAAGANTVNDISLNTRELRKHRDTARSLAVKHAKEKATAIAKDLGCKLGPPITVSESSWGGSYYYYGNRQTLLNNNMQTQQSSSSSGEAGGVESSEGAAFSAGTLSITATINVVFELVPDDGK